MAQRTAAGLKRKASQSRNTASKKTRQDDIIHGYFSAVTDTVMFKYINDVPPDNLKSLYQLAGNIPYLRLGNFASFDTGLLENGVVQLSALELTTLWHSKHFIRIKQN